MFPLLAAPAPAPTKRRSNWLVLTGLLLALTFALGIDRAEAQRTTTAPEVAEKRADLDELRQRIESLRKELSASEGNRAEAADQLRQSERQISQLQRQLHELGQQRSQLQNQLGALEQQSSELGQTLTQQQLELEKLLYRQYLRGNPDTLQLLLNGDDPNQMARDLYYLSAIAAARSEMMRDIRSTLRQKKQLADSIKTRNEEILAVEKEQKQHHAELEKQRQERRAVHAEISSKVRAQRREIGTLQRDEKRMSELVARLSRILAQQARAEEEARRRQQQAAAQAAAQAARQAARPTTPGQPAPPPARASGPENRHVPVATQGNFARLKGSLRLPTQGTVSGRFGRPREGGGQWRGVFIRTDNGSPVRAIANGRVVFSEWMRGFGNLLIIDHGDAYLSIYGNNDSLLKQVGQAVTGGEMIATVGNTGGNPESGLYFEIRHKGQPIDPLSWASLK